MNSSLETQSNKSQKLVKFLFYSVAFIIINLIVCPLSPIYDDWVYSTAPNPDFAFSELLPQQEFWRPFDVLFGALMGKIPSLFPALNRVVVVLGHVLNTFILGSIAKELKFRTWCKNLTVCLFLLSSATWAVTVSPDALNQAYSVLFGLLAIWVHLKKGGLYYLPLCLVATLWKESGISWFFVVPIFEAFVNNPRFKDFVSDSRSLKSFIKNIAFSFAGVLVYFVARFALQGSVALGSSSGTYQLSIFSFSTIRNLALLFVSAATGVDSVSFFGHNRSMMLVAVTVILSMMFALAVLVAIIKLIKNKKYIFPLLCILVCIGGLALPLSIIGNAGEMHAYPVLSGMVVFYGYAFDKAGINIKKVLIPVLCLFFSFGISSYTRVTTLQEYSTQTLQLTQNIREVYEYTDDKSLFVEQNSWEGYSVFDQTPAFGSRFGESMMQYYDWRELNHEYFRADSDEQAETFIMHFGDEFEHIYIINGVDVTKIK